MNFGSLQGSELSPLLVVRDGPLLARVVQFIFVVFPGTFAWAKESRMSPQYLDLEPLLLSPVGAVGVMSFEFEPPAAVRRPRSIAESADAVFAASSYPALRRLVCEFDRGVLVLRGRVPTYYVKQIAFATAKKIAGIVKILDCLEVNSAASKNHRPR